MQEQPGRIGPSDDRLQSLECSGKAGGYSNFGFKDNGLIPVISKPLSQLEYGGSIIITLVVVEYSLFFFPVIIILPPIMGIKVRGDTWDGIFMLKEIDLAITVSIKSVSLDI